MPAGAILLKAIMQEIDLYEEGAEDDKEEAEMVGKQDPVMSPNRPFLYLRYLTIFYKIRTKKASSHRPHSDQQVGSTDQ